MASHQPQSDGLIVGINVTPMVDIMLVLLIIFIVTAKIIVTPAVPMDLPEASQTEQVQVVLSIIVPVRGGTLVDGEPATSPAELQRLAAAARARDPGLRAVIHADGEVSHRRVLETLDNLKQAGLVRVAFGASEPAGAEP
ncbi:MAG: biopolymer transporter ExbD [Nannocystis sp.]|nr:biopolymer transporter ExbD [Nannocystis sp.]MBA3547191.1 biopolymer transporter ExbD [Nannocystis sp.]